MLFCRVGGKAQTPSSSVVLNSNGTTRDMLKENGETLGLKPYLFILDCGELFKKGKAGCLDTRRKLKTNEIKGGIMGAFLEGME